MHGRPAGREALPPFPAKHVWQAQTPSFLRVRGEALAAYLQATQPSQSF